MKRRFQSLRRDLLHRRIRRRCFDFVNNVVRTEAYVMNTFAAHPLYGGG